MAILLLIVIGAFAFQFHLRSLDFAQSVDANRHTVDHVTKILTALDDAETGQRGFLLTGREEYLEPFYSGADLTSKELPALLLATANEPLQHARAETLKTLTEEKLATIDLTIKLFKSGQPESAVKIVQSGVGKQIMDQIRKVCRQIRSTETAELSANSSQTNRFGQRTLLVTVGGSAALVALLLLALIVIRSANLQRERHASLLREQALILDLANDSVFIRDADDRITYWNQGAERLYGWRKEEVLGHVTHTLLKTKFPQPLADIQAQLLSQGSWRGELIHTRRDDSLVTVASNWTLQRHESGGVTSVLEINNDISARKDAERQLLEQALILDLANDTVFLRDAQDRITYWNQGAERLYGWSKQEALGQVTHTLLKTQFPQPLAEIRVQLLSQGSWSGEITHTRRDGSLVAVSSNWTLQRDKSTGATSVLQINRDIAERKRFEAELQSKTAEMERFTYTVSHDLKSPLITIKSYVSMIDEDLLAGNVERSRTDLQRVAKAAEKMQILLQEVLTLSRVGRIVTTPETVPFASLVQEAIELTAGRIQNGKIHVELTGDLPTVTVDRPRLVEVLQNLIDNAAKFMGDQIRPEIIIGADNNGAETRFFVKDNGLGVDPKFHKKIFGLFDKLDPKSEGSGAGLAIVKRIVELHGGRIWVESPGHGLGATFYFTLQQPVAPPELEYAARA